jgi:restriction system protein
MSKIMWMVRAGRGARFAEQFETGNYVSIGWNELTDLSKIKDKEELANLYKTAYPNQKPGQISMGVGQILRFILELKIGDYVVSYNHEFRIYLVGKIISDYKYLSNTANDHQHHRDVEWLGKVSRDDLSVTTKNTIGAIMTLFQISDPAMREILGLLSGDTKPSEPQEEELSELDRLRKDVVERGIEFIKDNLLKLDWDEMQELVAGILRGMGYKTRVSDPGPDRGKDIIASPDGLGLEQPRIKVEVKHRTDATGAQMLRSFLGGLRQNDKGLYVSTGGFSKEARYEAERSTVPVALVDADQLAELLIDYYDNLDTNTKALMPLMKVYWPA